MTTAAPPKPTKVEDLLAESSGDAGEHVAGISFLRAGARTLLASRPKVGKTELLGHLIAKVTSDPNEGGVLVLTEESRVLWKMRCERLGITKGVQFYWKGVVLAYPWSALCKHIAEGSGDGGYGLVVVDSIGQLARIPETNDDALVTAALTCLDAVADAGAAALILHHQRKSEGSYGDDVLGSTAYTSWPDVIVLVRRVNGYPRRRLLQCGLSRFGDEPDVLMELSADRCEYRVVGDGPEASGAERTAQQRVLAVIDSILPDGPPGLTRDEIQLKWPTAATPQPSETTLKLALLAGVTAGRCEAAGRGVAGDPFRYWRVGQSVSPKDSAPDRPTSQEAEEVGQSDGQRKVPDRPDRLTDLLTKRSMGATDPGTPKGGRLVWLPASMMPPLSSMLSEYLDNGELDGAESPKSARPPTAKAEEILAKHQGASATAVGVRAEVPR